jgi:4-amino-4-deoxy-L-arabinose transferase-like glycosyltransferase
MGRSGPGPPRADQAGRLAVVAGLVIIVALGVFLRLYRLDEIPPGLQYDEAYYGLDALRVVTDGIHPIFFENNNGREPFFIYLLALVFRVSGFGRFPMRLTAALLGALTLPATYLLTREVFSPSGTRFARAAGLFATLVLATLYWHVHYSRLALRAISMPLVSALTLWLFWRALRLRRRSDFLWGGIMLGVSMYSYLAARLLAPLLCAILVLVIVEERDFLRRRWRELIILLGVALLVSLPLWIYFLQHPAQFAFRLHQITVDNPMAVGDTGQTLGDNIRRTLLMFTSAGDWGWPDNLPGRPVLDGAGIVGLALGLLAVAVHFRKARYTQWLVWLLVMILPSALTSFAPTFTRSIGAIIPTAGLVGLGFTQGWDWLTRRLPGRRAAPTLLALLLFCVGAYSGWSTYRDYFLNWAAHSEVATTFNEDMRLAGLWVTRLPAGSDVYVSFAEPQAYHATLDFFVRQAAYADPPRPYHLRWYSRDCLALPPARGNALAYLLPAEGATFLPLLRQAFPVGKDAGVVTKTTGEPLARAFTVRADAARSDLPAPTAPAEVALGDTLRLLGGDAPGAARAGDTLELTLYWSALQPASRDYTIFAQMLGEKLNASGSPVWGQTDAQPCQGSYPTTAWEAGDLVVTRHRLPISADAPAGAYRLHVGMYDAATGVRLPASDVAGRPVADNSIPLTQIRLDQ